MSIDPIADQFAFVSPFNYAENSPIANIDLHGLQKYSMVGVHELKGELRNLEKQVSDAVVETFQTVVDGVQAVGDYVYDNVVGNDDIGNVVAVAELATEEKAGKVLESVNKVSKVLGPVMSVAEGAKILNEGRKATTEEQKAQGVQDAAKLGTEIGLGVLVPAAGVPANILIRTSRDCDCVTNPENLERAAGSFEQNISPIQQMVQQRIEERKKRKIRMIDYLFWRIYSLFNKKGLFPGIGKLEYRASALLGILLFMNLITVGYLLGYPFFEVWDRASLLIITIAILASMFYYARISKIKKLKEKFEGESNRSILKGNTILFIYIIASFLLLLIIA